MKQRLYRAPRNREWQGKKTCVKSVIPGHVREWWYSKISSGLVSTHVHTWRHGVEYVGNLPWPALVSLQALYEDFCYEYGGLVQINKGTFYYYLRKTIPGLDREQRKVRHKIEDMTIKSTSLRFVPLPRVGNAGQDHETRTLSD